MDNLIDVFTRLKLKIGNIINVVYYTKDGIKHIERVFADGKTKYGLTKTYFKTREKVHRELTLLYACMNLKKFALHHYA